MLFLTNCDFMVIMIKKYFILTIFFLQIDYFGLKLHLNSKITHYQPHYHPTTATTHDLLIIFHIRVILHVWTAHMGILQTRQATFLGFPAPSSILKQHMTLETACMKANRWQPPPLFWVLMGCSCGVAQAKVGGVVSSFSVAPLADYNRWRFGRRGRERLTWGSEANPLIYTYIWMILLVS